MTAGGDWSQAEVDATVASYLSMLRLELAGQRYNKSEFRRQLLPHLMGRTHGAVERKHQNISAILIAAGFPSIIGYKPLRNVQERLTATTLASLGRSADLQSLAEAHAAAVATAPVIMPRIRDILVEPPASSPATTHAIRESTTPTARHVDYFEIEARNRSLGAAGEAFALAFERARLHECGRSALADRVEQVSKTLGDGLGFDIHSYEADGSDRFIEVKTTAYGIATPFFVTRNELRVSTEIADRYHLYRAFAFRNEPRMFTRTGPLDQAFALTPDSWRARPG